VLHEHAASLSAASHANRSRRLTKCAKDSGHYLFETPMFVDSKLTRMVQVADLCAYSLRRFVENAEADLFKRIFLRADRYAGRTVGIRHYAALACVCQICVEHR
jgi:hypothetical protein